MSADERFAKYEKGGFPFFQRRDFVVKREKTGRRNARNQRVLWPVPYFLILIFDRLALALARNQWSEQEQE